MKRGEFYIRLHHEAVKAEGYYTQYEDLAITKYENLYTVTHISSGLACSSGFSTLSECTEYLNTSVGNIFTVVKVQKFAVLRAESELKKLIKKANKEKQ